MYRIIKTEAEYETAMSRLIELGGMATLAGDDLDEFELLSMLVKHYEDKHCQLDTSAITPLDVIKFRMEQNGLTQADMTVYLGSPSKVSEVLSGKRPLSLPMIKRLHHGLGIPADLLLQP